MRPLEGTNIVCDVRLLPFRKESFSFIQASDILEHIGMHECHQTLMGWYRVLKGQGEIQIKVPCFDTIINKAFMKLIDGFELVRLLYGNQSNPYDLHKNGFSLSTIKSVLTKAGFKAISAKILDGADANNMEAVARK